MKRLNGQSENGGIENSAESSWFIGFIVFVLAYYGKMLLGPQDSFAAVP